MATDPERLDRHDHWEGVHAGRKATEVSWYQDHPACSLALIERTGFGRHARLIDIGGGISRLVDALLERMFDRLTVLDISESALAQARCRVGAAAAATVEWVAADVLRWQPTGAFDVWHDRAMFHFLTAPGDRTLYRGVLEAALRPGGQAIIATFALDGPERCSGLPVVRYDPRALAEELGGGFALLESLNEDHRTPAGRIQRFQYSRFARV